eukprot:gb/GEZN01005239.1/.p1 GENE.gb/GEZN01005239.1/~~gb/GEZN01005239.1/.p1  ORF type:complete len:303 (-),score=48.72 gb/GEZN01005239.1/:903-1811(-)
MGNSASAPAGASASTTKETELASPVSEWMDGIQGLNPELRDCLLRKISWKELKFLFEQDMPTLKRELADYGVPRATDENKLIIAWRDLSEIEQKHSPAGARILERKAEEEAKEREREAEEVRKALQQGRASTPRSCFVAKLMSQELHLSSDIAELIANYAREELVSSPFTSQNNRYWNSGYQNPGKPRNVTVLEFPMPVELKTVITAHYWWTGTEIKTQHVSFHNVESGKVYGPWFVDNATREGTAPADCLHQYWYCLPGEIIPRGSYEVHCSVEDVWSWNSSSNDAGFVSLDATAHEFRDK